MRRLLDVLLVCALAGYVLAGTALAPFHGDESTLIYMSRDFFAQFVQGDVARLRYSSPPASAQEQELRLLNGSLSKMLIGLSWALQGGSIVTVFFNEAMQRVVRAFERRAKELYG